MDIARGDIPMSYPFRKLNSGFEYYTEPRFRFQAPSGGYARIRLET
jgi:hypothetical protein